MRVKLIAALSVVILMSAGFAYAAFNLFSKEPELSAADWIEAKGRNIDERDQAGKMFAHYAAEEGRVDVLKLLYEDYPWSITEEVRTYYSDIDGKPIGPEEYIGWAPIHFAAFHGQVEVMKWLKEQGADVNEPERDMLPMHHAAVTGQLEAMK